MDKKIIKKISVLLLSIYMPLMFSVNFWHTDSWDLGKAESAFSVDSASDKFQHNSEVCSVCSFFNSHALAETTDFDFTEIISVSCSYSLNTVSATSVSFASLRAPPTV